MSAVPVAPASAVEAARRAHRLADRLFVDHYWRECGECSPAAYCPEGQRLLDAADDAGKRWRLAEERQERPA